MKLFFYSRFLLTSRRINRSYALKIDSIIAVTYHKVLNMYRLCIMGEATI